jgi:bifunctional DNA-binding transcriptional regulator/antitoxin component of YhaV-PrlF toxin-antitoxin module
MPDGDRLRMQVTSDGQVILPKALCERHGWTAGTELVVEDGANRVTVQKAERVFPPTRLEDVAGMLKQYYSGPPVTIEQMNDAITEEVLARHARGYSEVGSSAIRSA